MQLHRIDPSGDSGTKTNGSSVKKNSEKTHLSTDQGGKDNA
jgi:hypothetical protein